MRRRAKRLRLRFGPIFGILLLLNCVVGYRRSRVTAVTHVVVSGVPAYDQGRVSKIISTLSGVPSTGIRVARLETEILREPAVRRVRFHNSLFGKATLQVTYRNAVAKLGGRGNLVFDEDGVLFLDPTHRADLMTVKILDGGPPTTLTIAGCWQPQRIAKLAVAARAFGPPSDVGVQVDRQGVVSLSIGSGRAILGSSDDLEKKLSVLTNWLQDHPKGLSSLKELILIHPDAPAEVPLPKET